MADNAQDEFVNFYQQQGQNLPAVAAQQAEDSESEEEQFFEESHEAVVVPISRRRSFDLARQPSQNNPNSFGRVVADEEGMDCFGDERESLREYEKFYNNSQLSDVSLVVGDDSYPAHKLVLAKSSEVFERMVSQQWDGDKKRELELIEDRLCVRVFPAFLRFLYCSHVVLHYDNTLPILILADKYNVASLRKVCLDYAKQHIIPNLPLKEVFHVWFQYGTKGYHQMLVNACVGILSQNFQEIMTNADWEREWFSLDRDQLAEFLKSSEIEVKSEFEIWGAVLKWLQAPSHPERQGVALERNLSILVPQIRFPMMSPDELCQVQCCPIVEKYPKIFNGSLLAAFKYNSLSLASRVSAGKEFTSSQFLLRTYTDTRWDKRLTIPNVATILRHTEVTLKISTKASALPVQSWDWELKVYPKGYSQNNDDFRCYLFSNVILDQTRPIEYMLSIVDDKRVMRSVSGKKNFSKTRYQADMETEKKVSLDELTNPETGLIVGDCLCMQLTLRPIE